MLIANIADLHARGKDLDACRHQLAAAVAECVKRKVDLVTFAGDIFGKSNIADSRASTGAITKVIIPIIAQLAKHDIEVLMIPGDHDFAGAGSEDCLHVFDERERISICREARWLTLPDVSIFCLPWEWDAVSPSDSLQENMARRWEKINPTMLLAHIRVTGAKMNEKKTCEEKPEKRTWQISRAFLNSLGFDHYALGNFHIRQDLTEGRGGYIGALRQLNFGEEGNPAGFELWNSETNETEWVEIDAAPRYRTIEIEAGKDKEQSSYFQEGLKWALAAEAGEHLKIRIHGGEPDRAEVKRLEAEGVTVEHIIEREERIQRAEVPTGIIDDPHGLIRLWAGTQHPPIDGGRLERMLRIHDEALADKEG